MAMIVMSLVGTRLKQRPNVAASYCRAKEPSQPTEPSVSHKELTPPKPAQPSISSPSSMSSTTLGTTTVTTEEEMSEGEMIQVCPLPSHPC